MPVGPIGERDKWSIFQKKKLLRLLKEYPIDAYESIAEHFSDRDAEQVGTFIRKMKQEIRNKNRYVSKDDIQRVPLEEWLDVSTDLVDFESVDCSANLIRVQSIISKFEDFQSVKVEGYDGPDYSSIYKFMSQILQPIRREDLVQLGPLENAIMLDMIHSLMDVLSEHDTSVQRNVMKWKYQLMNYRNNKKTVPELLRKASENDYKEFIEDMRKETSTDDDRETIFIARRADTVDLRNSKQKQSSRTTAPKQSSTIITTQSSSGIMTMQSTSASPSTASCSNNLSPSSSGPVGAGTSSTSILIDEIPDQRPEVRRHKPGRKGMLDQPETPRTEIVLVMPPKGVKIVNYEVRGKKCQKQRIDGKYRPLSNKEKLISDDLEREVTYDVHRSEFEKAVCMTSAPVCVKTETDEEIKKRQRLDEVEAKYDELLALHNDESRKKPVKKQKLYSINPFCLPVSLIDLDSNKI